MAGFILLILGLVGVVLPLLPTTPFLLAAAYCFGRSSDRMHKWMLRNRLIGAYIRAYLDGGGLSLCARAVSIFLLWAALAISALLVVDSPVVRLILLLVGVGVTIHLVTIRGRGGKTPDTHAEDRDGKAAADRSRDQREGPPPK
jgi:uncharacterized protein